MSWPALGWASKQRPARSADKIVLIALADRHNEDNDLAWPSLAWLCDFCCLDRKTVIAALDRLQGAGFIEDSGQRAGRTGQVKAYRLALNSPEITIPKPAPLNGPVFPSKQSQKRNTDTSREPTPLVSSSDDTFPADNSEKPLTVEEAVEDYNEMAAEVGLPLCRKITAPRRRAFKARLREYPDLADWKRAFMCIRNTPWMHGENDRGWRADFDFLLQAKSFTKLTEEAYGQAQRRVA